MKNLLKFAAGTIAAAVFTLAAHAQPTPSYGYNNAGAPLTYPSGALTNLVKPVLLDGGKEANIGLMITTIDSAAGGTSYAATATNLIFWFAPTLDGISYDTNQLKIITQPIVGAAAITNVMVTNLPATGIKGWYLISVTNSSSTGTMTNTLNYGLKLGAP